MSLEPLIPGLNSSRRVTCGTSDKLEVRAVLTPPLAGTSPKLDPALRGAKSHLPSHLLCPFSQASLGDPGPA